MLATGLCSVGVGVLSEVRVSGMGIQRVSREGGERDIAIYVNVRSRNSTHMLYDSVLSITFHVPRDAHLRCVLKRGS